MARFPGVSAVPDGTGADGARLTPRADRPRGRPGRHLALGLLVLLPMPAVLAPYPLIGLCHALLLGMACLGLNLLLGTTGLLSLGHAAYFGLGAYAGALLFHAGDLRSLEVYLILGVLTATATAALAGAVCVRATRIHFTIMTLALGQLVHALFVSGAIFRPLGDFGRGLFFVGEGGLYIPRFRMLGLEVAPERFVPVFYYVVLAGFLGSLALLWRVDRSPFGMALRAIRDNDLRAAFVGIPVRLHRWRAFVLSAAIVGLAGGLHGQLDRQVTPEQLGWLFSARLVVATIIGGPRRFLGPVLGGALFVLFREVAERSALSHDVVLGTLLILVVAVRSRRDGSAGGPPRPQ